MIVVYIMAVIGGITTFLILLGIYTSWRGKQKNKKPINQKSVDYDELEIIMKKAIKLSVLGNHYEAIAIYDKVLDEEPNFISALTLRAQSLEQLNYNLDAIDDYELAESIGEIDGNTYGLMGLLYKKVGMFEKAKKYLTIADANGAHQYGFMLPSFEHIFTSDTLREMMMKKINESDNLKRRNRADFIFTNPEIDEEKFNDAMKKNAERYANNAEPELKMKLRRDFKANI